MKSFFKNTKRNTKNFFYNTNLFDKLGLNKQQNNFLIKQKHILVLTNYNALIHQKKQKTIEYLNFSNNIKNYKNFRNILGYPCRGQRTHTNAKTKKRFKIKI